VKKNKGGIGPNLTERTKPDHLELKKVETKGGCEWYREHSEGKKGKRCTRVMEKSLRAEHGGGGGGGVVGSIKFYRIDSSADKGKKGLGVQ